MATFQERFNRLFEESEKTQKEFGQSFEASEDQVFNWRRGRGEPDSETMKKIAETTNVSIDWLLGHTNIRNPMDIIAFHRNDDPLAELPPAARKSVEEFLEYIYKKYGVKDGKQ